jgi:hypothetical protein
VDGGPVKTI